MLMLPVMALPRSIEMGWRCLCLSSREYLSNIVESKYKNITKHKVCTCTSHKVSHRGLCIPRAGISTLHIQAYSEPDTHHTSSIYPKYASIYPKYASRTPINKHERNRTHEFYGARWGRSKRGVERWGWWGGEVFF